MPFASLRLAAPSSARPKLAVGVSGGPTRNEGMLVSIAALAVRVPQPQPYQHWTILIVLTNGQTSRCYSCFQDDELRAGYERSAGFHPAIEDAMGLPNRGCHGWTGSLPEIDTYHDLAGRDVMDPGNR
jgi:hypothetical protein